MERWQSTTSVIYENSLLRIDQTSLISTPMQMFNILWLLSFKTANMIVCLKSEWLILALGLNFVTLQRQWWFRTWVKCSRSGQIQSINQSIYLSINLFKGNSRRSAKTRGNWIDMGLPIQAYKKYGELRKGTSRVPKIWQALSTQKFLSPSPLWTVVFKGWQFQHLWNM